MEGQLSNSFSNHISFGASETLIICGTVLMITSNFTAGIIFSVIGTLGSIIKYSIKYNEETRQKQTLEKLYQDITDATKRGVQTILTAPNNDGTLH